jgi:hypothetical protein
MDEVEKIVRTPPIEGVEIVRKGPNGERIVLWEDPLYPAIRKFMDEIFPCLSEARLSGASEEIAERVSDQSKPASNNRN